MTELLFKGKEFVYNHHLAIPHRPLVPDSNKSVGKPDLTGNLIIQGDNLHALKSLLPLYANTVDCIFIDPPYNTGKENWCYNDNVNSPMIEEWFSDNPIGVDDGLRHDKWCAMMWPRLKLLHELLAESGVIVANIDDNELHHLSNLMNEIFGAQNFLATIAVVSNLKGNQDQFGFAGCHEYVVVFAKDISSCNISAFELDANERLKWQSDDYGLFKAGAGLKNTGINAPKNKAPNLYFPIYVSDSDKISFEKPKNINGWTEILPITEGQDMSWRWSRKKFENELHNVMVVRSKNGITLRKKQRPEDGVNPTKRAKSVFYKPTYSSSTATSELKEVFGFRKFDYPKPVSLISDFLEILSDKESLILDSFAGSGTTAHAVLQANDKDGGNRKFILVEMDENVSDAITVERVQKVITGYSFNDKNVKGLGGTFTYCSLGEPVELHQILTGKTLPTYETLAPVIFHMATNHTLELKSLKPNDFYVGEAGEEHIWMIYQNDLDWLKSDEAALTLTKAKKIMATAPDKKHLVFAPARFVSEKVLRDEEVNVSFVPLPYALYQIEKE